MKKLSDYKDEEAIELWGDLLEPLTNIISDNEVKELLKTSKLKCAQVVLKKHKSDAITMLKRIDDSEIDGLNLVLRLTELLAEIGSNEDIKGFFGFAELTDKEFTGSVTENTEEKEA